MSVVVAPGIYLEDNPPTRRQFGDRRDGHKPTLILSHTGESGTDLEGPDLKAENVARFIAGRSTAGSYHRIGDRDSIIRMVRTDKAAFGSRFVNDWAAHISLAMNADIWPYLSPGQTDEYLDTWQAMAVAEARNILRITGTLPPPVLLTGEEARRPGATGHCSHGRVDPDRRTDPGDHFPWEQALTRYADALGFDRGAIELHPDPKDHHGGSMPTTPISNPLVAELQAALAAAGYNPGPADGIYGPRTSAAALESLADRGAGPYANAKAEAADRLADAYRNLMAATS